MVWPAEGGKFEENWEEIMKFPLVFCSRMLDEADYFCMAYFSVPMDLTHRISFFWTDPDPPR